MMEEERETDLNGQKVLRYVHTRTNANTRTIRLVILLWV